MKTKISCPHCSSKKTISYGKYKRKRSRQIIQRYKCLQCNQTFSDQTFSATYKQKRPELNQKILEMISIGAGVRKTAMALRTTKNTVQKKIKYLAEVCDTFHKKYMKEWEKNPNFQFDEMETCEHSRHATLNVPVIVEESSHFIVTCVAQYRRSRSQIPGPRDRHNLKHYKEIGDKEKIIKEQLKICRDMKPKGKIGIETDKHRSYPGYMKDAFKKDYVHTAYNAGIEEDKMKLFPVNNIIACIRADVAMLRRETWHVCKKKDMLSARLKIYIFISNYFKKKEYCRIWKDARGKKHKTILSVETPAMKLGIFDSPVGYQFLLNNI